MGSHLLGTFLRRGVLLGELVLVGLLGHPDAGVLDEALCEVGAFRVVLGHIVRHVAFDLDGLQRGLVLEQDFAMFERQSISSAFDASLLDFDHAPVRRDQSIRVRKRA